MRELFTNMLSQKKKWRFYPCRPAGPTPIYLLIVDMWNTVNNNSELIDKLVSFLTASTCLRAHNLLISTLRHAVLFQPWTWYPRLLLILKERQGTNLAFLHVNKEFVFHPKLFPVRLSW